MSRLSPTVMQALRFSAVTAEQASLETALDEDVLEELRGEVERLIGDVLDSNLDPRLAQLLVVQLENVRQAILAYRLRGLDVLEMALERAIGAAIVHWGEFEEAKEAPQVERFKGVLGKLGQLLGTARQVKELVAPIIKYLSESGS